MVQWFAVHHTGSGPARPDVYDTANYQTGPTAHIKFPAIAYTMYVDGDGKLHLCHDLEVVSYANGDGSPYSLEGVGIYNWWTISCCFSGDNPNNEQLVTIRKARRAVDEALGRSLQVKGHRQISGDNSTECPGSQMNLWLPYVRS